MNRFLWVIMLLVWVQQLAFSYSTCLTPSPKNITYGVGEFTLPRSYTVVFSALTDSRMRQEAIQFVNVLDKTTGYRGKVKKGKKGTFVLQKDSTIDCEGYMLDISMRRVTIKASTATGLFYAFQSIRQMFPPHIMAETRCDTIDAYRLPVVRIA